MRRAAHEAKESYKRGFCDSGFRIRRVSAVYHRRGVSIARCSTERRIQNNMVSKLASLRLVSLCKVRVYLQSLTQKRCWARRC